MPSQPARNRHVGLALLAMLCGCDSPTAPRVSGLTPAAILRGTEYALPVQWISDRDEIVFVTSNDFAPGTPRQINIIRASDGARRVLPTTLDVGDTIAEGWLTVTSGFAYFPGTSFSNWLYRSPLGGQGPTERVVLHQGIRRSVSPDDRLMAWTESGAIVMRDIATGVETRYPVSVWSSTATDAYWDPTGRGVAFIGDFGVAWLDPVTSQVGKWTSTDADQLRPAELSSRIVAWVGTEPVLYSVRAQAISRYFLNERRWEDLAPLEGSAVDASWSADGSAFAYWTRECVHTHRAIDGGAEVCDASDHHLTVLRWASQERKQVALLHLRDAPWMPFIPAASFAPSGRYVAFTLDQCGGGCYTTGDGLYVRSAQ